MFLLTEIFRVLGPFLFIIFINDLSIYIEHASVIMYADDAVLYVFHESKEKIENDLNQDMQNLLSYFRKNELVINLKKGKTETIIFGTTKRLKTAGEIAVLYNNQRINFTETYKYLGNIADHQVIDYVYLTEWDAVSHQKLHDQFTLQWLYHS